MNKKMNWIVVGALLNTICFLVDRFIMSIPDMIAIPIMIVGIILILIGILQQRTK